MRAVLRGLHMSFMNFAEQIVLKHSFSQLHVPIPPCLSEQPLTRARLPSRRNLGQEYFLITHACSRVVAFPCHILDSSVLRRSFSTWRNGTIMSR
jgi:hypothetical protein